MARRKGQDDLARQARLNDGCCPTHGVLLVAGELEYTKHGVPVGQFYDCPRADCDYTVLPTRGTKMWRALTRTAAEACRK